MLLNILLDATKAAPKGGMGGSSSLILIVGMVVVFYFFILRPQQKKQKKQKEFINSISKGDKVVTIGGIYGKILDLGEEKVTIELEGSRNTKMVISRNAISMESSAALNAPADPKKEKESKKEEKPEVEAIEEEAATEELAEEKA